MAVTIKLSEDFINTVKQYADVYNRSIPKQIEYWAFIGKIAEENPNLSYIFIKDVLLALKESEIGAVEKFNKTI